MNRYSQFRAQSIALSVICTIMAGLFFSAGASKLLGLAPFDGYFQLWGYPVWFMYFIGLVEIVGAALLIIPNLTVFGTILLGSTMIGAALTHSMFQESSMSITAMGLLVTLTFVGYIRRQPLVNLVQADTSTPMHKT